MERINEVSERLASAGWTVEKIAKLADGLESPSACCRFTGPRMKMQLHLFAESNTLKLHLTQPDGRALPGVELRRPKDFDGLIDAIIERQASLTRNEYPDLVEALVPTAEIVLLETDKGWIRASM